MARILGDQGDLAGAFDAWVEALRFDPMRIGALKGIAFLYFRAGDVDAAALNISSGLPRSIRTIESISQALARVRGSRPQPPEPAGAGTRRAVHAAPAGGRAPVAAESRSAVPTLSPWRMATRG